MSAVPLRRALVAVVIVAAAGVAAVALLVAEPWRRTPDATGATRTAASTAEEIERGAYLARLGNCAGCHSAPGAAPYAGGRGIETPFGTAFAGNLTPDAETGIGRFSREDFWQALHRGRGRDGRRLLPVFPYPSYTRVSRADSDALYAYLRSLAPVRQANAAQQIRFPYGTQAALALWQALYFEAGDGQALPRGQYLVEGLGHCGACHAPRSRWGAEAARASGADMPTSPDMPSRWYAPSLHPTAGDGVTADDLVDLLRSGRHRLGSAGGPMAGVVRRSTQHWSDADLRATAEHLLSLPAQPARQPAALAAPADSLALGRRLYADRCAECHGDQGQGALDTAGQRAVSPLAGNPTVLQPSIRNLVQVIRQGGFAPATAANPRPYGMPPHDFSDAEIAALINHLRQALPGPRAAPVSELDVLKAR